jgi:hypothetical protein
VQGSRIRLVFRGGRLSQDLCCSSRGTSSEQSWQGAGQLDAAGVPSQQELLGAMAAAYLLTTCRSSPRQGWRMHPLVTCIHPLACCSFIHHKTAAPPFPPHTLTLLLCAPCSAAPATGLQSLVNQLLVSSLYGTRLVTGVLVAYQQCLLWSSLKQVGGAALL